MGGREEKRKGWGFARNPLGELTALLQTPSWICGPLRGNEWRRTGTEKRRERRGKEKKESRGTEEGERTDGEEGEGKGREGADVVVLGGIDAPVEDINNVCLITHVTHTVTIYLPACKLHRTTASDNHVPMIKSGQCTCSGK